LPKTVSTAVALALAAIVIAEAAIIAVLARRTPAPAAAAVVIESPTPGDTVEVNGKAVGITPFSLAATAGTRVRVLSAAPTFEGAAAKAIVPPRAEPAPAPVSSPIPDEPTSRRGGLRLVSPIDLTVLQGDRVLGSTSEGPIFLPSGTQQVQLVNTALGYKATQSLTVRAGQIGTQRIELPNGKLNLNAQPGWARVSIDGNAVGDTPLANVAVPIGEHEIVFRHPQLGEKRERVVVRAEGTQRVTVSFDK
jgi:hypothetical protein